MVQRTGIQYYRLTVYFTTQAPTRSMSPPGRDARYIYQSARSLRLKTRLRLDQGARTAFLLIHAVLRLFTLGKCKRSFTHCSRENVLKFEILRMARIINQGTKSTSKRTLFFTHRRDFSMQFVWGKILFLSSDAFRALFSSAFTVNVSILDCVGTAEECDVNILYAV